MKLIVAIVNSRDCNNVINDLTEHDFHITQLSTTGGFLRAGNKTLLIGVEDERVDAAIEIIRKRSHQRKQLIATTDAHVAVSHPMEIIVGGATVFVLDVDQFEKL